MHGESLELLIEAQKRLSELQASGVKYEKIIEELKKLGLKQVVY